MHVLYTISDRSIHDFLLCLFVLIVQTIEPEMIDVLLKLQTHVPIGLITGSDIKSVESQLGHDLHQMFDYVFVENGMVAYQKGQVFAKKVSYHGNNDITKCLF